MTSKNVATVKIKNIKKTESQISCENWLFKFLECKIFFLNCFPTFGSYALYTHKNTTYRVIENLFHALVVFKIIGMFYQKYLFTLVYLSFGFLKY
ncbi:MAG: hypothetical protein CVU43_22005 [Chloroflexi bacterium HGW-Chloroflexi-5]|nr:MAG: hypothetical protein CVU43_22005 [Chloroflexi bacterium HGW-Chloroflexi-5]